jgi:hypothetical protein
MQTGVQLCDVLKGAARAPAFFVYAKHILEGMEANAPLTTHSRHFTRHLALHRLPEWISCL